MPLSKSGNRTYSRQQAAKHVVSVPNADKRATGFGYGVPLREQIKTTRAQDQPRICSIVSFEPTTRDAGPEFSNDPTISSWVKLPTRDDSRKLADEAETARRAHPCGVLYTRRKRGGN
jgi:hypothetical protein